MISRMSELTELPGLSDIQNYKQSNQGYQRYQSIQKGRTKANTATKAGKSPKLWEWWRSHKRQNIKAIRANMATWAIKLHSDSGTTSNFWYQFEYNSTKLHVCIITYNKDINYNKSIMYNSQGIIYTSPHLSWGYPIRSQLWYSSFLWSFWKLEGETVIKQDILLGLTQQAIMKDQEQDHK